MVEEIAESLGASRAAIFKWRQRGVPSEWQIRIVEASNKMLTFADIKSLRPESQESPSQPPFRGDEGAPCAVGPEAPAQEAAPAEEVTGAAP